MTTNLLPLLTRLHQAAPEMCKCNLTEDGPDFTIGEFVFFFVNGKLYSSTHDARGKRIYVTDRPALAWLTGSIRAECARQNISLTVSNRQFALPSLPEALLTALVEAVEADRVR